MMTTPLDLRWALACKHAALEYEAHLHRAREVKLFAALMQPNARQHKSPGASAPSPSAVASPSSQLSHKANLYLPSATVPPRVVLPWFLVLL